MTSKREQFYKQQISDLQVENAALKEQVAEVLKVNAELAEKVAKLSKNSSNSSKPPSSDIVKPPKAKQSDGPRHQGGQFPKEILPLPSGKTDLIRCCVP